MPDTNLPPTPVVGSFHSQKIPIKKQNTWQNNKWLSIIVTIILMALVFGSAAYVAYWSEQQKQFQKYINIEPGATIVPPKESIKKLSPTPTKTTVSTSKFIEFTEEIKESNEINNWKTYTGQRYSIKYPSEELFTQVQRQNGAIELTYYKMMSNVRTESIKILISKESTAYKSVLEMESPFSSYIKIGNYPSLVTFSDTNPPDSCGIYNLINNEQLYTLNTYNPSNPNGGNCDSTYLRQILSTFKFTNQ